MGPISNTALRTDVNLLTYLFAVALALNVAVEWWLATRQLATVRARRAEVPPAFSGRISLEAHQKAADYTIAKTRLHRIELVLSAALLLAWTLGGGLDALDSLWRASGAGPLLGGVGLLVSAMLVVGLLDLPLEAYRVFGIEQRFGFNRMSWGLFFKDALKSALLLLALGVPLAAAALWLMDHAGPRWWVYLWLLWMGFSLLMVWAYPTLIAPLFNRFQSLEDARLRARIEALLARNGFAAEGIFVMDGSKRSGHGNAYFTGLGTHKRIVFFDTLLGTLEPEEIEAVLAHEIGHFKRRHIAKQIGLGAVLSLAGLGLLGWLAEEPGFYSGLGVEQPSMAVALVLFMLVIPVFTFFLRPLGAWLSRRHEFEADDFAARQADARALIQALVKLYKDNASTLTPDPLYSAFHDSHPPAPVRIAHLAAKLPSTA